MGTSDRTFVIVGAVAIPVGHRVEVSVYCLEMGTFTWKPVAQPKEPLVHDLNSGITYSHWWHHMESPPSLGDDVPLEIRELPLDERVVGRVVACHVVLLGAEHTQTSLVVRPDAATSQYR